MAEHLIAGIADGVGTITFNRPEKRNAVSPEMVEAFLDATYRFEEDPQVRCVLLRGAGETFMAGGDVEGFRASLEHRRADHLAGMERRIVNGQLTVHRLRRMPKPVIVAVHGAAAGFGLSVVCAADLALAAEGTRFTLAYRHVGLTPDGGASHFLPRIIGERRALQLALTGEPIDARQALDWGLVNWVVPGERLETDAEALALSLAAGPTKALAGIKRLLRGSLETGWDAQLAAEARAIGEMTASEDHYEGVCAFLEKRPARFTGR